MTQLQPLEIALILLWREGRVCVTQRHANASHLPNAWEFPGGKVEPHETPREACVREAREELGVSVGVAASRASLRFEYLERVVTLLPFDCELLEGEPQPLSAQNLRWLWPHELRDEEFPPANVPLLQELRANTQNQQKPA